MRETDDLLRIFAATIGPLVASGCSQIDETQFSFDVCSVDGYDMLESVVPDEPVDYVELSSTPMDSANKAILDASGELCAGASDAELCAMDLASLDPTSEFTSFGFDFIENRLLAYTRGDEVAGVRNQVELLDFLGAIDSPGDAALLGTLMGHELNCGAEAEVGEHPEGFVLYTQSGTGCGQGDDVEHHVVLVHPDGTIEVIETELIKRGDPGCAIGRLPAGLCRRGAATGATPVGRFFAEVAGLEAAAVPAFAQLTRELVAHGAPPSMILASRAAEIDEIRHARVMARVARRFGGRPQRPTLTATATRSLAAVAEDNAIEGCVRETYGALVAHVQARRARTPELRRVFARIAQDETRHAGLSWSLARWADARLPAHARARVARRRAAAVERLRVELTAAQDPTVHAIAGLPGPAEARALFDRLDRTLR